MTETQKYIQEIVKRDSPKNNFEWLVKVANDLRFSRGFYTRLWDDLNSIDDENLEEAMESVNNQTTFNEALDVILWLEQ